MILFCWIDVDEGAEFGWKMMNGVGDESRVPSFSIFFFLIKDIPFLFFISFFIYLIM